MFWSDYLSVFFLGLAGSGHCISMCGGFALATAVGGARPAEVVARHLSYQLGKATSYAFLVIVILLAGGWVGGEAGLQRVQVIIGWIAGGLMIAAGLAYATEYRLPMAIGRWWQGSAACGVLNQLWRSPSLLKSLLIGWVNGFLPCGLSLTALLYLASWASLPHAVGGAYIFGLGTLPGLLAVALLGQRVSVARRRWLVRVGGALLVVFGVLTLLRGTPIVHGWLHEHLVFDGAGAAHGGHAH